MKLAIFDFDGTIYRKETFTLLMQHLKTTYPKNYRLFFAAILPIYIGYKLKLVNEKKMKARLMERYIKALEILKDAEIDAFFADVAHEMKGDFNKTVIERLRTHKQAGYYTMIVSGAFTSLLRAVDQELGLDCDAILGTEIPHLNQPFIHVHAEQKPHFLYDHLKAVHIDWDASCAYGDSISDLSVLELVGQPVAVCPDKTLTQIAEERNWEILQ